MKSAATLATATLSALLACAAGAEAPAGSQASPELRLAASQLQAARHAFDAGDYATAVSRVEAILHRPDFDELPIDLRYDAVVLASLAASGREDLLSAHEYAVFATAFPQARASAWSQRALAAIKVENWQDAGASLTTLAKQWPTQLGGISPRMVDYVISSMRSEEKLREDRLRLIDALYQANYVIEYGLQPAYWWSELVAVSLDRKDTRRAREILQRIDDAQVVARMRIDKRFDELVAAEPRAFDVAAVAHSRCVQFQDLTLQHPRELQLVIEYMYAQNAVGKFRENVALANRILKQVERAPKDSPPFDDPQKLNWIYDIKSNALQALGRWDEAEVVKTQARAQRDTSADKVSQAINLGEYLNDRGRPAEALKALEGIDWANALSDFGRMQLQHVRLRAYLQLGQRDEAEKVFAYMREHQEVATDAWETALLDWGDVDAAAALYIARLRDPDRRVEALWDAQSFRPVPSLPNRTRYESSWNALMARPDVIRAIDEVGRRETLPIYDVN